MRRRTETSASSASCGIASAKVPVSVRPYIAKWIAIAQSVDSAATERARRKPLESLDAYDCYLRGMACLRDQTREKTDEALALARRAIGFDANFTPAHGLIARCHGLRLSQGWTTDDAADEAEVRQMAARVAAEGQNDAVALAQTGQAMAYVCRDVDTARELARGKSKDRQFVTALRRPVALILVAVRRLRARVCDRGHHAAHAPAHHAEP